jgi:hypothetical protein
MFFRIDGRAGRVTGDPVYFLSVMRGLRLGLEEAGVLSKKWWPRQYPGSISSSQFRGEEPAHVRGKGKAGSESL